MRPRDQRLRRELPRCLDRPVQLRRLRQGVSTLLLLRERHVPAVALPGCLVFETVLTQFPRVRVIDARAIYWATGICDPQIIVSLDLLVADDSYVCWLEENDNPNHSSVFHRRGRFEANLALLEVASGIRSPSRGGAAREESSLMWSELVAHLGVSLAVRIVALEKSPLSGDSLIRDAVVLHLPLEKGGRL